MYLCLYIEKYGALQVIGRQQLPAAPYCSTGSSVTA